MKDDNNVCYIAVVIFFILIIMLAFFLGFREEGCDYELTCDEPSCFFNVTVNSNTSLETNFVIETNAQNVCLHYPI